MNRRWLIGADILWIFALMIYVLAGTRQVPFHGDESTLIMMSRDYYYQFIAGNLAQVTYHDPPLNATEQQLRLLNGTVPKYLIGLAWHVAGFTVDDLNDQWDWGAGWDRNVENGHMPAADLLLAARWYAALLTALSVPLCFALAALWGGRGLAYPAALLMAVHPAILVHGRRAYMEAPLLFFGLLVVLIAAWWAGRLVRDRVPARINGIGLVALGLAAGLAVASKHSGAVMAAAGYLGVLIVGLRRRKWPIAGALLLSGIVAAGVFLALNPAWWSDPIHRPAEVLALRADLVNIQKAAFPDAVYPDFPARLAGLVANLSTAPTAYYEVGNWADYIAGSIARYEASPWTGVRYGANALTDLLGIGLLLLSLLGALRAAWDARRGSAAALVIGLWAALTALFILGTIPLAWQRYYMPLYPAETILAGGGLAWVWSRVRRKAVAGEG